MYTKNKKHVLPVAIDEKSSNPEILYTMNITVNLYFISFIN